MRPSRSAAVFPASAGRLAAGRAAALRLAAAAAVAALCLGAKVSRIVPPPAQPPISVSGGRVTVAVGGLDVSFELLDEEERLRYLRERGAEIGTDPFASDPTGRYQFTTFRFDLVNRTPHEVNLHPASLRAVTDQEPHFPLEYTAAYEHFVSRRRLEPWVVETLGKAALFETLVIPAGGKAGGLLVYRDLPERFKRFQIQGVSVLVGAESKSFAVPFGVIKVKAPPKKHEKSIGIGIDPVRRLGDRDWR